MKLEYFKLNSYQSNDGKLKSDSPDTRPSQYSGDIGNKKYIHGLKYQIPWCLPLMQYRIALPLMIF